MAVRAFGEAFLGVLKAAVHTAVPVVVHAAISDVIPVHQVDDVHDRLRIVGCIAVDFNVEDVASALELVVWSFDFGLVLRRAVEIDRNVA